MPEGLVRQVLDAARLAPSACNQQPWRFGVVRDAALRRRVVEEGFLPGFGMSWALDAPVHVVLGMELSFFVHRVGASVAGVDYPWVDLGIAGEHLVLAATELGLGTCWIGWIKPKVLHALVGWENSVQAVAVITLGWPVESALGRPPEQRRKALDELTRWL